MLAQAGIVGMEKDQASRVELEDVAVAVFDHLMGSSIALEYIFSPCSLSYPDLAG